MTGVPNDFPRINPMPQSPAVRGGKILRRSIYGENFWACGGFKISAMISDFNSNFDISISRDAEELYSVLVPCKYCPMCGRKLGNREPKTD